MDSLFADILDNALSGLAANKPAPKVLTTYPEHALELAHLVQTAQLLASAQPVTLPTDEAWQADRAAFLRELKGLPENAQDLWGHNLWAPLSLWFGSLLSLYLPNKVNRNLRKEWSPMSMVIAKVALALVLMFGAVGGTAVAAADSLPDSPLYGVKTAIEDIRLGLTSDPVDQAHLQLVMAQTRIQEMQQLALTGGEPGEATLTRLQNHLQTALQLAANASDERMNGVLTRARLMLQGEGPGLLQAQQQVQGGAHEALGQAYQIMNQVGQIIEDGLQDPQTFRYRYTHNRPEELPEPPVMEPNPGGVITHTMPITHTPPITTPVQAGPGYGPGEPFYGPGEPGGNPEPPNGPQPGDAPGNGPDDQPGFGPGETPGAGFGPGHSNSPSDPGSDSPGSGDSGSPQGNGQNGGSGGNGGGN